MITEGEPLFEMETDKLTITIDSTAAGTLLKIVHGEGRKPRNITELAAFVAAVRPAFKSMLPVFLARKHFDYGIPAFDRLIQTREMTSSFLLFQEQLMKTLQHAGFTAPESYAAIKAIGKKHPEKVLPLKQRFLEAFAAKSDTR